MNNIYVFLLLCIAANSAAQQLEFARRIDVLLGTKSDKPFNGAILIAENGKPVYARSQGVSNQENKTRLQENSQYVVGSISKQFTAVLVLRACEKGKLNLQTPIRKYLPDLRQPWADTVTVHHLLSHTHGIVDRNKMLRFRAGSAFDYSQLGYQLLAEILENIEGRSFEKQSARLFDKCGMKNTFHQDNKRYKNLATGYFETDKGVLSPTLNTFENYPAAGGFVSTPADLVRWNAALHGGKLLTDSMYHRMTTPQPNAVREHPLFGPTLYGYGITIMTENGHRVLAQTGYAPGFTSLNFYYPDKKRSIIVLSNVACCGSDLKAAFRYHTAVVGVLSGE